VYCLVWLSSCFGVKEIKKYPRESIFLARITR
jgi:hypothetical protein